MAYFRIDEPNKSPKWIKSVDNAKTELVFTESRNDDCYYEDSGFFADSEKEFLQFHFMEKYPELQYLSIDDNYSSWGNGIDVAEAIVNHVIQEDGIDAAEAPQMLWNNAGQVQNINAQEYAPVYDGNLYTVNAIGGTI